VAEAPDNNRQYQEDLPSCNHRWQWENHGNNLNMGIHPGKIGIWPDLSHKIKGVDHQQ
jgi:hypothetical protein